MKTRTLIRILIAAAIIISVGIVLFMRWSGTAELSLYNSRSMMDWKLGGKITGIASVEDIGSYDPEHFKYFSDKNGCGLKSVSSNTRYYLDFDNGGSCRVIGFTTTANYYSIMGIRIGDDELESRTVLLDNGYSMDGGGLDRCRATSGKITVYLNFEHGIVTGMAAFIK